MSGLLFTLFLPLWRNVSGDYSSLRIGDVTRFFFLFAFLVILGVYSLLPVPGRYVEAPLGLVILQILVMIVILSWVERIINQRKLFFIL